jgi:DNA-binding PadR family transcriptional regulator
MMTKRRRPQDLLPLSPPVFHILLAIGNRRLHGYAIMQEIQDRTGGSVTVLPGTLYSSIGRMLEDGLITETYDRPGRGSDDQRRRYYRVTKFGRAVAGAESERMALLLRVAEDQELYSGLAAEGSR